MRFVRFGSKTVNMDQVTRIIATKDTVEFFFHSVTDSSMLHGSDVIAFEQWLEDNCENARAPMESDPTDHIPVAACIANNI